MHMIIIQVLALIYLIFGIISIKLYHKFFNPVTIMCGIWSVILYLSSLCLFELCQASINSYFILALGVCFFMIGFTARNLFKKKYRIIIRNSNNTVRHKFSLRTKLVWALLIFTLVFEFINAKNSISILSNGGSLDSVLLSVRANASDARGTITNVINNLIVGPFKFAIVPICAYHIANKKQKIMSIFVLILLGIGVISSGGRVLVIYFIVSLCVSFTISHKRHTFSVDVIKRIKKQKKRFVILILFVLFIFILLSISRSGERLIQHTYLYFSMQPIMFETWTQNIKERGLYGCGEAALNGFTFHFLYLIKNIFSIPFPKHWYDVFNSIMLVDTNWKPITTYGLPANAYVSAFWYFYLDARIIGVILESFIWGWCCANVFKNAVNNPNIKNICLYSMFLFSVVDSYVRIRFATSDFVGGLLLMYFIFFRKKVCVEREEYENINCCSSL